MSDISVLGEGSIVLLRPETVAGRDWVEENIGRDNGYQPYWPTVVVERRYADDIVEGMQQDGLAVEVSGNEMSTV